jgi:hypothetical protein
VILSFDRPSDASFRAASSASALEAKTPVTALIDLPPFCPTVFAHTAGKMDENVLLASVARCLMQKRPEQPEAFTGPDFQVQLAQRLDFAIIHFPQVTTTYRQRHIFCTHHQL